MISQIDMKQIPEVPSTREVLLKSVQAIDIELNNLATCLCALDDEEEQEQIEILLQLFKARRRRILRKWRP